MQKKREVILTFFYFQNQQERRLVEWRNEKHDAAQNEHFINVLSPYLLI